MILYNSENSIRDVRPFCSPLFCHSRAVKCILNLSYIRVPVARFDCQILLKSPPLNLLAGSAPGKVYLSAERSRSVTFVLF